MRPIVVVLGLTSATGLWCLFWSGFRAERLRFAPRTTTLVVSKLPLKPKRQREVSSPNRSRARSARALQDRGCRAVDGALSQFGSLPSLERLR